MFAYYIDQDDSGWMDADLCDDAEEEEAPAAPDETVSAERLETLTRQLKELRSALHDAERAAGRLKDQLRMTEQKGEADRAELTQLRDTLYQLRAGEGEADVDSGPLVELPWRVKRRVVVFGGHDSWRKAVKPCCRGHGSTTGRFCLI